MGSGNEELKNRGNLGRERILGAPTRFLLIDQRCNGHYVSRRPVLGPLFPLLQNFNEFDTITKIRKPCTGDAHPPYMIDFGRDS